MINVTLSEVDKELLFPAKVLSKVYFWPQETTLSFILGRQHVWEPEPRDGEALRMLKAPQTPG